MVIHQLITRGTAVTLQWVPSHVGVRGNECADRAAKAAEGVGAVPIKLLLSFSDIKCKLTSAVWGQWGEEFAAVAEKRGYGVDLTPPSRRGVRFPSVPAHLAGILYRLTCDVWRCIKYLNTYIL